MKENNIVIRSLIKHKAGTLYTSLPESFSKILTENSVVAYPSEDGKSIILKPAPCMAGN